MAIRLVNKHTHTPTNRDIYCGRGGALGNDWDWRGSKLASKQCSCREEAIANFRVDFLNKIAAKDESLLKPLRAAYRLAKSGDLNLVCFCAPDLDCHARIIKEWLEEQLDKSSKPCKVGL